MSGADGTSVLLKLSNLEMVSQYAQSLAASMKLGSHHQFEVVSCSLRLCLLKFNVSFRHCYGHIGDIL